VQNNVIYGNDGGIGSGGLVSYSGIYVVRNNIIWANSPPQFRTRSGGAFTVSYCDVDSGYAGTGNIDVDPDFADITNFYLNVGSPAIDAGNPASIYNDVEDPNSPGNPLFPALGTLRNDMGAWGGSRADELDPDADGILDLSDNCPDETNPSQSDIDGDGYGDACDRCNDTDGDGFGDPGYPSNVCATDNCPSVYNPDQDDTDGDGVGDACDQCPGFDDFVDTDGDGIADGCDDCTDTDGDGYGNPGSLNTNCPEIDNCPYFYNPDQEDTDGDGVGDSCSGPVIWAYANDAECVKQEKGYLEIIVKNLEPIDKIVLPISMTNVSAKFFLDSVSFVGTRLDYFEDNRVIFDNRGFGQIALRCVANIGGGSPALLPGHGPVARVHYRSRPNVVPGDTSYLDLLSIPTQKFEVFVGSDTLRPDFMGATLRVVQGCECLHQSDMNGDNQLNSVDLNSVIDILFFNAENIQDPFCPGARADFDYNGSPDALDLNLLIEHLYFQGGAPCAPCNPIQGTCEQ